MNACVELKKIFISPGRIPINSIGTHNDFYSKLSDSVSGSQSTKYEVIGHGCASWRYYPMKVNSKGIVCGNGFSMQSKKARNVVELIDSAISIDSTMSIELDAHYIPESIKIKNGLILLRDTAIVLHDIPKWNKKYATHPKAIQYFRENSLRSVVEHFVKKNYYTKVNMYVEIKVKKKCDNPLRDDKCDETYRKLALELAPFAKNYSLSNHENWLCITSFSPLALEKFRSYLPNDVKNKFNYVLILGYTGGTLKSIVAQIKGYVPKFTDSIMKFMIQTEWLDYVWFSVQGIKKYREYIYIINQKRNHNWKELQYSFSTYPYKKKKMARKMLKKSNVSGKIHIRSFMLDLDYQLKQRLWRSY